MRRHRANRALRVIVVTAVDGPLRIGRWCRDGAVDVWNHWDRTHRIITGVGCVFALAIALIAYFAYFAYVATAHRMAERERRTAIRCLAANVYHEARGEPRAGQVAVAEVTMNRVVSSRFPDDVCAEVHQEAALSWMLGRTPGPSGRAWARAVDVAARVHDGDYMPVVPGAPALPCPRHRSVLGPRRGADPHDRASRVPSLGRQRLHDTRRERRTRR